MVLQTLLLRRNFPCPHFFGLGEGPEFDPNRRSRWVPGRAGMRKHRPFADGLANVSNRP